VRGVQLRGLAPDQVLVLINGKRRHASAVLDTESSFAGTVPVDVNAIPPGAIDHIEILRDGAGAQYGSDAVAGVINIVLKQQRTAVGLGQLRRQPHRLQPDRREQDRRPDQNRQRRLRRAAGRCRLLALRRRKPQPQSDPARRRQRRRLDLVEFDAGRPRARRQGGLQIGRLAIAQQLRLLQRAAAAGEGVDAYSFATLNKRQSDGSAYFRYPGDPSNVLALYPNGYRPVTHGDQSDVSVVAGVRIASGGWNWDLSARHGGNIFRYDLSNSANASLGAQSPTSFHLATFDYRQDALNADLTRELNLGGVPVNLAIGAEYSRETYTSSPGDAASYAAGPITDAPPGAQAGPACAHRMRLTAAAI
jgi:iron complex outermembrane receptor protein